MELAPPEIVEGAVCTDVSESEIQDILDNTVPQMLEILKANEGKGLAAPQVGIMKNFFIMLTGDKEYKVFFNPKYYAVGSRTQTQEARLTYGKDNYKVCKRFKSVQAHYDDVVDGKFQHVKVNIKGYDSFAFQHESDHVGNGPGQKGKTIFM